ncbi:MAG: GlyGly-CTERM sorting domain-containing protein [Proteobacteria bacterium]|jgi:hypothetical protein|nr:GlyGly-CTERM sorting domain-containing protein [Pseudomonadota bacterium]
MMRILPILLAFGCPAADKVGDIRPGTAVGNPGNMDFAISAYPEGVELSRADVLVDRIVLEDCDTGAESVVELQVAFDALGPSDVVAAIPTGDWCFTTIELWSGAVEEILTEPSVQGEVILGGVTDEGITFQVGVNIGDIKIPDRYFVDETDLLVGINLDVYDILIETMNSTTSGHIELDANEVYGDSGDTGLGGGWSTPVPEVDLWLDSDEDGAISDEIDERNEGTGFFTAPDSPNDDADAQALKSAAGCGCAADGGQASWLALLLLPLIRRRRR